MAYCPECYHGAHSQCIGDNACTCSTCFVESLMRDEQQEEFIYVED